MKKIFLFLGFIFLLSIQAQAATVSGGISKVDMNSSNRVVDASTNAPIGNAKISLPKYNFSTYTDEYGAFDIGKIDGTTIMSVEKAGYRPFSLTINNTIASKPMVLGIQKSDISDIVIESDMIHLGDDNYSSHSSGAGTFRLRSSGPFYSKSFVLDSDSLSGKNYLVIGSIIGVDTLMARSMGQNKIVNSYASPPEIFFNGSKIAEIQLNGDNQKIKIPNNLIRANQKNEVTIKAGRNLMQRAYVDYDDIEIANLSILSEN